MKATIIRQPLNRPLDREVWEFSHWTNYIQDRLCIENYQVEHRDTPRHKWKRTQTHWQRRDSRNNTIIDFPLPEDVIQEAKNIFKSEIDKLEVTR